MTCPDRCGGVSFLAALLVGISVFQSLDELVGFATTVQLRVIVYHLSPSSRAIIQDKGVLMQAREIGGESWHKNGLAMAARSGMTRR